ncbi:MAG TPA: hypothetical protein VMR20_02545 [Verrucomicrobiae bacterium]|nr:hypothetical protein [Verrucomicrobiae bacterium]
MKRPKKLPIWLRRMELVRDELKAVRSAATAGVVFFMTVILVHPVAAQPVYRLRNS